MDARLAALWPWESVSLSSLREAYFKMCQCRDLVCSGRVGLRSPLRYSITYSSEPHRIIQRPRWKVQLCLIVILALLGEAQAWGKAKQQASKSSAFLGARRKKQRSSLSTARGDREDHSPATNSRPREAVPIHTAYQTF